MLIPIRGVILDVPHCYLSNVVHSHRGEFTDTISLSNSEGKDEVVHWILELICYLISTNTRTFSFFKFLLAFLPFRPCQNGLLLFSWELVFNLVKSKYKCECWLLSRVGLVALKHFTGGTIRTDLLCFNNSTAQMRVSVGKLYSKKFGC